MIAAGAIFVSVTGLKTWDEVTALFWIVGRKRRTVIWPPKRT